MRFRKLRIAWAVTCGIACVLLIVLWVRSYSFFDSLGSGKHGVASANGCFFVDEAFTIERSLDDKIEYWSGYPFYVEFRFQNTTVTPIGVGWRLTYWIVFVPCLSVCVAPSLPWRLKRFSLRTLLIATTLVAMVLGAIVYAVR